MKFLIKFLWIAFLVTLIRARPQLANTRLDNKGNLQEAPNQNHNTTAVDMTLDEALSCLAAELRTVVKDCESEASTKVNSSLLAPQGAKMNTGMTSEEEMEYATIQSEMASACILEKSNGVDKTTNQLNVENFLTTLKEKSSLPEEKIKIVASSMKSCVSEKVKDSSVPTFIYRYDLDKKDWKESGKQEISSVYVTTCMTTSLLENGCPDKSANKAVIDELVQALKTFLKTENFSKEKSN